jgi:hypothetical protein
VDLYVRYPLRLHGVVLSELSTGTTSHFICYSSSVGTRTDWPRDGRSGFDIHRVKTGSGTHLATDALATISSLSRCKAAEASS